VNFRDLFSKLGGGDSSAPAGTPPSPVAAPPTATGTVYYPVEMKRSAFTAKRAAGILIVGSVIFIAHKIATSGVHPADQEQMGVLGVPAVNTAAQNRVKEAADHSDAQDLVNQRARQLTTGQQPGQQQQQDPQTRALEAQYQAQLTDERDRERKRLYADPRVPIDEDPPKPPVAPQSPAPAVGAPTTAAKVPQQTAPAKQLVDSGQDCRDLEIEGRHLYAVCEGVILTASTSIRLTGTYAGPVNAGLEQDVWSHDGQHLILPKGSLLLGKAQRVEQSNDPRTQVIFHRILLPDGKGIDLKDAIGLNQAGDVGLKADKVNHHVGSTFGTAVALGAIGGLSLAGTGGAFTGSGYDQYRQGVASSVGSSAQTILGRQLNRPPDVTVNEGHIVQVYVNRDMWVPEWGGPAISSRFGK
jgi:type IV secretory pathway VirB10-like protein